ncbi:hypothetical protein [Flavobacterium sp.]|uniref:hypothetical protein n=1 Tax=Flavobacterium sp. TaxID=239 RepID=UPI004047CEF0
MRKKTYNLILILAIIFLVYEYGEYTFYKIFPSKGLIIKNFENKPISNYYEIVKLNKTEDKPSLIILNSRLNSFKPLLANKVELKKISESKKINLIYCNTFQDFESSQNRDWYVFINKNKFQGIHVILSSEFNNYKTLRKQKFENGISTDDTPYYILIDKNGENIEIGTSDRTIEYNKILSQIK